MLEKKRDVAREICRSYNITLSPEAMERFANMLVPRKFLPARAFTHPDFHAWARHSLWYSSWWTIRVGKFFLWGMPAHLCHRATFTYHLTTESRRNPIWECQGALSENSKGESRHRASCPTSLRCFVSTDDTRDTFPSKGKYFWRRYLTITAIR